VRHGTARFGLTEGTLRPAASSGRSLLATAPPLLALLVLEPGSLPFFGAAALGGLLIYTSSPVMVVAALDLAPARRRGRRRGARRHHRAAARKVRHGRRDQAPLGRCYGLS
jgi:hypothetical protein